MNAVADLPALHLAVQLVLSAWMVTVAWLDHHTGRIPNMITAPVFLGVGAWRLFEGATGAPMRLLVVVAWALVFLLWMAHFIGGGDAKFLMGLYALFPSMEFTAVLALILLALMVPLVVWELRTRATAGAVGGVWRRVATGQVLPTRRELEEKGRRYAWTFAIPALIYTWLYW
jgi:Flp pilus assembly protein protease CpaA